MAYTFPGEAWAPPAGEGLFRNASSDLLEHLEDRVRRKKPAFLSPLNFSLEETVKTAYLMGEIVNGFREGVVRKTFFCNSHMEAVHGAIKLARHASFGADDSSDGRVLFFDPTGYYRDYFDPLDMSEGEALIPGIRFVDREQEIAVETGKGNARILVLSPVEWPGPGYLSFAGIPGAIKVLDLSRLSAPDRLKTERASLGAFDIVCWGEALTKRQLPFGAFTVSAPVFSSWDTIRGCALHSTTFGGNGTVLSYVFKHLLELFPDLDKETRDVLRIVSDNDRARIRLMRKHVNAGLPVLFRSLAVSLSVAEAEGASLTVRNPSGLTRNILDCVGSSGCNIEGHNNAGVIPAVLRNHREEKNYFRELNETLSGMTGLTRMFQGVSGASVVEMGIILSLLAAAPKRKILIFKGNYGGKTLAALNVTSSNHRFFSPLYAHVETFDPFATNASVRLKERLAGGDIALVWMEIIQGRALRKIPGEVLAVVGAHRQEYGYLVGVDGILNGVCRGGSLTSVDASLPRPDLLTLAKGLTGMLTPFSVLMTDDLLYRRALENSPALVGRLEKLYRNDLTCHIALDVLEKIRNRDLPVRVAESSARLGAALESLQLRHRSFKKAEIHGLHIHIYANMGRFPFFIFGLEKTNYILTRILYRRAGLLCLFGRLLPPLDMSREEENRIVAALQSVFSLSPLHFFIEGLAIGFYRKFSRLRGHVRLK
ncbi:MAG: aminotransferase class III-fold pyridoxal phosphate-dependent enzyme [Bacteroidetes bacterium]|nr:aminotransferase class III-fold pyridoxal phosphate-dependent enzyme [Bacteroidota bacterium]